MLPYWVLAKVLLNLMECMMKNREFNRKFIESLSIVNNNSGNDVNNDSFEGLESDNISVNGANNILAQRPDNGNYYLLGDFDNNNMSFYDPHLSFSGQSFIGISGFGVDSWTNLLQSPSLYI